MAGKKYCIGIEGTAHTAGIGIVDEKCGVLANERHAFTTIEGGLIPRELAEHHAEKMPELARAALEKSGVGWGEISCVAFSSGPGIGAPLSVAATTARMLSLLHNKPLAAVNHCIAHIEIAKKKCSSKDPLTLYVSGGNSQVIGLESGRYRVYGETLDIGVGNLLDSFGREIGLGFPAGPEIDRMFFEAEKYVQLPYSVKGMDVNFSGLLTAAKQKIPAENKKDLAFSVMHTAYAMLVEVTERALAHTGKKELLLTGGVASSKALQKMCAEMCAARGVKLNVCPHEFATDNGAMIAWNGMQKFLAGKTVKPEKAVPEQRFRTDAEKVVWI